MTASMECVVYPPGVRDLSEDISTDDLVRRLKDCAQAFQSMAQEEENAHRYEPLAHLLISERFLEHKSRDVRLLVACCIADIFRVSAPDAPYKDEYQIKMLLEFFIDQLKGLSNPDNPSFKRYFYLLENLSVVKTFNICFDLQDSQKIICSLFKLMFKIINDHQYLKLQRIILDLLCPLITESDLVPKELINIIFNHIIEPKKSENKNACTLAQEILRKTASSIESYIHTHFTTEFYVGPSNMSEHLCDLIYELYAINSSMMAFIIPQIESKLKSSDEKERHAVTHLVARMFSSNKPNMIEESKSLWTSFLARFNDISPKIRLLCIQYASNFLLCNEAREDITEVLKQRHRDLDETVRFAVLQTMLKAAAEDISCLNNELLFYVKERTLDKKFRIRRESLNGLAKLYKQYILDSDVVDIEAEKLLSFVRNKVFYAYYQSTPEDRYLVGRILYTYLVPYRSPVEKRMKLLYQLYCTIDCHSIRAFKELLKNQKQMRVLTNALLEIIEQKKKDKSELLKGKINTLAKNLMEPGKSLECIKKFCHDLEENTKLRDVMSDILNGNISCSEAESKVKEILRSLGNPSRPNSYYTTMKQLLERIAPVLVDKEGVEYLVHFINNSIVGDGAVEAELKLENSGSKGLNLINVLASIYPNYFVSEKVFSSLIPILNTDDAAIAEIALETLSYISKNLENIYPNIYSELLPILEHFIELGTPRQAKFAVHAVHKMVNDKELVFGEIIETLQNHFTMKSQHFRTALISIGHIAYLCHNLFACHFKTIVAQTVVRDVLMLDHDFPRGGEELWGPHESLPDETKVKIEGMKVMVRWLLGLKDMVQPCMSTFNLLNAILMNDGDLMEKKCSGPKENSWMRYSAANCILKLCREPKYADCLETSFFLRLAYTMDDQCPEVREHFAAKIHKGLLMMRLPLEFMAILALGGLDSRKDFRTTIKKYLEQNIIKRREYVKEHSISNDELPYHWPDYALPVVVYLFAHAPFFKVYNEKASLLKIRECLLMFIEALIVRNDNYDFGFFKRLLENIKQTKDKLKPDDEGRNFKLYAVSDLALNILMLRPNFVLKDFAGQPKLNSKFFTKPDKNYNNLVTYLPSELLNTINLVKSGFEVEIFDEAKRKSASHLNSVASNSQEETMQSTSNEEPVPSTSGFSNSAPQLKSKSYLSKKIDNAFQNGTEICEIKQSKASDSSGLEVTHKSSVNDPSENKEESSYPYRSVTSSTKGDVNCSDMSDMELDKDVSLGKHKMSRKSQNASALKMKQLPKRAEVTRKSTRSRNLKSNTPSSLHSIYDKQKGILLSTASATRIDSLCPPEYKHLIKPCCVRIKRVKLEDFPSVAFSKNENGPISFKRKYMDSDEFSSNQESIALSEKSPRKRGRPPKKGVKSNRELSLLPSGKRRKFPSISPNSVQSSRSISRSSTSSSSKKSPAKPVVKNGKLPQEKNSPFKSKLNARNSSSLPKNINRKVKECEDLNDEVKKINKFQKIVTKTVKSKKANGQQTKKIEGKTTRKQR